MHVRCWSGGDGLTVPRFGGSGRVGVSVGTAVTTVPAAGDAGAMELAEGAVVALGGVGKTGGVWVWRGVGATLGPGREGAVELRRLGRAADTLGCGMSVTSGGDAYMAAPATLAAATIPAVAAAGRW